MSCIGLSLFCLQYAFSQLSHKFVEINFILFFLSLSIQKQIFDSQNSYFLRVSYYEHEINTEQLK